MQDLVRTPHCFRRILLYKGCIASAPLGNRWIIIAIITASFPAAYLIVNKLLPVESERAREREREREREIVIGKSKFMMKMLAETITVYV